MDGEGGICFLQIWMGKVKDMYRLDGRRLGYMIDYGKAGLAVIGMGWIENIWSQCYEHIEEMVMESGYSSQGNRQAARR